MSWCMDDADLMDLSRSVSYPASGYFVAVQLVSTRTSFSRFLHSTRIMYNVCHAAEG